MTGHRTRALHRKHAGTGKHHSKGKHTPTAHRRAASGHRQKSHRVVTGTTGAKPRGLSPGDVQHCSAEALAASLRLTGVPVTDGDVLALYWHTAESAGAGASIWRTLEAAYGFGLGGVRPVSFAPVDLDDPDAVILGLELPEAPHAVALDASGDVWSWGGLYDLGAEAVIGEAWAVTWP